MLTLDLPDAEFEAILTRAASLRWIKHQTA